MSPLPRWQVDYWLPGRLGGNNRLRDPVQTCRYLPLFAALGVSYRYPCVRLSIRSVSTYSPAKQTSCANASAELSLRKVCDLSHIAACLPVLLGNSHYAVAASWVLETGIPMKVR